MKKSKNPGFEPGGHGQAQFLAFIENALLPIPCADERFLDLFPAQPGDDAFNAACGAQPVIARPDEQAIRERLRMLQARIVNSIKKVFHCTTHVTEIFGCSKDDAVCPKHLLRTGFKGAGECQVYAVYVVMRSTAHKRLGHTLSIDGWCMGTNEQIPHLQT